MQQGEAPHRRRLGRPTGGLLVGAFVTVPVFTGKFKLSLQPEIQYTQRRSKVTDGAGSSEVSIDYVAIPILLKLKLFGPVYILEGASFFFPVTATKEFATGKRDIDAKSDVSIVIALGMPVGSRVHVQLRWDSGIKAVQKSLASGEAQLRNRAISLVAAVHF